MTIHVVLLNWNQGETVRVLIQHILSWADIPLRIWVVDNASTDRASRSIPEDFPSITFLRNTTNLGYAGGINTALKSIQSVAQATDCILLLNNDIEIDGETVRKLEAALAGKTNAGMIGPVLVEGNPENPVRSWGGRDIGRHLYTRIHAAPASIPADACIPVDYVPGTVLLFKGALLGKIGLLDEEYFFSGEIADYAARCQSANLNCYILAHTEVVHSSHDNQGLRSSVYLYYSLRNRFLYIRKHQPARYGYALIKWSGLGMLMALKQLAFARPSGARAVLLAIRDGWNRTVGNRNEYFLP